MRKNIPHIVEEIYAMYERLGGAGIDIETDIGIGGILAHTMRNFMRIINRGRRRARPLHRNTAGRSVWVRKFVAFAFFLFPLTLLTVRIVRSEVPGNRLLPLQFVEEGILLAPGTPTAAFDDATNIGEDVRRAIDAEFLRARLCPAFKVELFATLATSRPQRWQCHHGSLYIIGFHCY